MGSEADHHYEVTLALDVSPESAQRLRAAWSSLGGAVDVRLDEGAWICHVHTDDIGAALDAAIEVGRPRSIRVVDLHEAPAPDLSQGIEFESADSFEVLAAPIGVVCLAAGRGLSRAFHDLRAQSVVMVPAGVMPRLADLVAAVDAVPAAEVILLPNNTTLVPLAEQVDGLSEKAVVVVPTRSMPQGLAAMMGYSLQESVLDVAAEEMSAAASSIVDAEVIRAERDARVPFGRINQGDWVGVADGTVIVADPDLETALRQVVAGIWLDGSERVTLITGEGARPVATKALEAWIGDVHTGTQVVVWEGGQPRSPYLVSIE